MDPIDVTYFSDVLCVWAYVSQARMAAVEEKFGDSVRIRHRFCSVFGDTAEKIKLNWKEKGGYEGFNNHLRHVAEKFPHIQVHPDIWLKTRPPSSASPHLFLKAVQLWDRESKDFRSNHMGVAQRVLPGLPGYFSLGRPMRDCRRLGRQYRRRRGAHSQRRCLREPGR